MFRAIKKKLKDQRGLTLIELLAVIVILGIISAIAIPSVGNIIQESRIDAVRADAIQVLNAAKMYHAQNPDDDTIEMVDLDDFVENVSITLESITVNGGILSLNATGNAGDVNIEINNATYEILNDEDEWTVTNNTITVEPAPATTPAS